MLSQVLDKGRDTTDTAHRNIEGSRSLRLIEGSRSLRELEGSRSLRLVEGSRSLRPVGRRPRNRRSEYRRQANLEQKMLNPGARTIRATPEWKEGR